MKSLGRAQPASVGGLKGLTQARQDDGGEISVVQRAHGPALHARPDPAGVRDGAKRRLPIAVAADEGHGRIEGQIVTKPGVGVIRPQGIGHDV